MRSPSPGRTAGASRLLLPAAVTAVCLFIACVDTTPPWEKVTAAGGAGGLGLGGAGGMALDGPVASGGSLDGGAGEAVDLGSSGTDGGMGGAGGAIDAPLAGAGGGIDAGLGGAGGLQGSGGAVVDAPVVATGGAGGGIDGGADVPRGGAGGGSGTSGTARTGGATGAGGTTRTGGATGTGGARTGGTTGTGGATGTGGKTGTGGATGTGGLAGTGGAPAPDAGPDVQPDTSTLANGLLAYYPCESASGSILPDMSGHGNDATLSASGSYSLGSGPKAGLGNALTLIKANSGYVAMPPAMFGGLTQITIATWVKIVTPVDWQRLFDIGVNANRTDNPTDPSAPPNTISYMNFVPQGFESGPAVFSVTNTGYANEQRVSWTSALPTDWKHVAIVLSGSTGTLYIDGGPDGGSPIVNSAMTLSPASLGNIDYAYIGRSQFSVDPYFDGAIDDFRVYNRALSATEIQALYQLTGP